MTTATLTAPPAVAPAAAPAPDLAAVKTRQQAAWSSGDYAVVGTTLQIVGEQLCEALDLRAGQKRARRRRRQRQRHARRRAPLVRRDLDRLRAGAARARPRARRGRGPDGRVPARPMPRRCRSPTAASTSCVSTFGVMFTPNQDKAAAELLRVCKPGGKIGLANWTPDGFIGQLFKTLGKHMPPPAGVKSPALWGTRARIDELFGAQARVDRRRAARVRVPLPLGRSTGSTCSGPTTGRCSRRSRRSTPPAQAGAARRPPRADRPVQPRRRRHDGGAERIPRGDRHQAVRQQSRNPLRRHPRA